MKIRSWANNVSTFPDSTSTETLRKLVFSLTRACVSVRKSWQWIPYEQVDRFECKVRCMLQVASNRKPSPASTVGPIFPHNLGRRVIFAILWTLISRKLLKVSEYRGNLVDIKFRDLKIWLSTFLHFCKMNIREEKIRFTRYYDFSQFVKHDCIIFREICYLQPY